MLVLWLIVESVAAKFCPIVSNALLGLLIIATGVSSQTKQTSNIGFLALFTGLILALLLSVYSWNTVTNSFKIVKSDAGGERSVTVSQPPVVVESEA